MKKGWYIFLLFVPVLLFSQENKPKFLDRIQLIPEFQVGKRTVYYKYYSMYYDSTYNQLSYKSVDKIDIDTSYCAGININYKQPFMMVGIGVFYTWLKKAPWYDPIKIQLNISGNLLFFTKAAKTKLGLYLGPSFVFSGQLAKYDNYSLVGFGGELSLYNVWIRFSKQYYQQDIYFSKYNVAPDRKDTHFFISIGYGFDLNTFRKKENKRFDL